MAATIKKLTIEGFKSIRKLEDFELRPLNVLIGPNGAGKSNLVSFFRLLREMIEQRLQVTVARDEGGADACLFMGPKITAAVRASLHFGENTYRFSLAPTGDNRFIFLEEVAEWYRDSSRYGSIPMGSGHQEARLRDRKGDKNIYGTGSGIAGHVFDSIASWVVYHFHDTSLTAGVRRAQELHDNEVLRPSAENLAPFLFRLGKTHPADYLRIRDVVRLAAPFFDDFHLRPIPTSPDMIQLEWRQRDSDYPFRAIHLSDGTLRFICLATALLQPMRPPTMLFDEPELGLHPYALSLLGNLFKQSVWKSVGAGSVAVRQVIVSTQSSLLLSEFAPEDVGVVDRIRGESTFRRLDSADLSEWLEEYSLGDLWQKNLLGGRPREERSEEPASPGGANHP